MKGQPIKAGNRTGRVHILNALSTSMKGQPIQAGNTSPDDYYDTVALPQ